MLTTYQLVQLGFAAIVSKEFLEQTVWSPSNWKDSSAQSVTNMLVCTNNGEGPYFGRLTSNVHKLYENLPNHYGIVMSVDILFTGKWKKNDIAKIRIDSNEVYANDDQLKSSDFLQSSAYCVENNLKQNLITKLISISHSASTVLLEVQSSYSSDEELAIKNLIFQYLECHPTCLTCSGPTDSQCLTCPQGSVSNGQCTCSPQVSSQNTCVPNCPLYQAIMCNQSQCQQCESGYLLVNNGCYTTCPSHASVVNGICTDYINQSAYGSTYLTKAFYTLDNNIQEEIQKFTFTSSSTNSKLTEQTYSIYEGKLILGGFGVWADGQYQFVKSGLPQHNKIRIYLTTTVKNWSGAVFSIKVDGVQVFSQSSLTGTQTFNTITPHDSGTITISFISTLSVSAFDSSIGLYDIFILADNCEVGCSVCGLTSCLQCTLPLKLVQNKCIVCGATQNRNTDCTCRFGYYESNQETCTICPNQCESCNNATQCNTCNTGLQLTNAPLCNKCVDGYYMDGSICKQCMDKCQTCSSQSTCTTCNKILKLYSPPSCQGCDAGFDYEPNSRICVIKCPNGQFRISLSKCQICAATCAECQTTADTCTVCAANRVSTPQCNCPEQAYDRMEHSNAWCTTCSLGVAFAQFSDDLNSITVTFGTKLQQNMQPGCEQLLRLTTLSQIGSNPKCLVTITNLIIFLGSNASVQVGTNLQFNSQYLIAQGCTDGFSQIISTVVERPNKLLQPQVILNHKFISITNKEDFVISIQQELINAKRPLKYTGWELNYSSQKRNISALIQLWNAQKDTTTYVIPRGYLSSNESLTINLNYVNMLNQNSNTSISIQTINYNIILEYPSPPYYSNQQFQFYVRIDQDNPQQQTQITDIQVYFEIEPINQRIGRLMQSLNYKNNTIDNVSTLILQPFTLYPNTQYQARLSLKSPNVLSNIIVDDFIIQIQQRELIISIQPTINLIGYKQTIELHGFISNPNILIQNISSIEYTWSCLDIINKIPCQNIGKQPIVFNQSLKQTIPSKSFEPYTVLQITLQANKQQTSTIIYLIENDIPKLILENQQELNNRTFNYYDSILLKYNYQDNTNPDDLQYVAQIFQGTELIGYFIFHYLHLNLQLWKHIIVELTLE